MPNISPRYQRKAAANYDRQQMAAFDALYSQATASPQAPATPPPQQVQPKQSPGVLSSLASGSIHGIKKAVHEMFNSLDELSTFVARVPDSKAPERHNFSNLLEKVTGIQQSIKNDVAPTTQDLVEGKQEHDMGAAYNVASGLTQFITAFIPINRTAGALTKGMKLGKAATVATKVTQGAVAGGVASAVAFDPYEKRLSNLVQSVPALQNPITDYLQASPDDSKAVARMKNGVENALLGAGIDLSVEGGKALFSALRAYKGAQTLAKAGKPGEEALAAAQEVLAKESKNIRDLAGQPKDAGQLGEVVQPKEPVRVEDVAAPDPKPIDPVPEIPETPKATSVENPEVLPEPVKELTADEIQARLVAASKEGRIQALSKLEPERDIQDITQEVDSHLAAASERKADTGSIETVPEISGEQIPLSSETPEGELRAYPEDSHLQVPDYARTESDSLPTGSIDQPQLLPKWTPQTVPEEFRTAVTDSTGRPYDIRNLPLFDERQLPPKMLEIAGSDGKSVTGFLDSLSGVVGNERGGISQGALKGMASGSVGASSGFFVDYNGDGKVGTWEDVALGLTIGTGGYVASKAIRGFLHGTHEVKAAASEEIQNGLKQQLADLNAMEGSYQELLQKQLPAEAKTQVERSLSNLKAVRDALTKYEDNPGALDKVLNRQWVKDKYKPLVSIPEGKTAAITQALREGRLEDVSKEIGTDFNLSGIKAPDDIKEALDHLTNLISESIPEETEAMTRGVVSWDETLKGADELGVSLHNVNELSKDTRKLSERLLAARVAMNSIKTPLLELTDQILASADPTAEQLMNFKKLTSLAAAVQAEVKGSQTEVARALNSMKIAADTVKLDFEAVSQMLEQQGGKGRMVSAVQKLKALVEEGDSVQVNRYLRGLAANPSLRFLNELHRTVLLSNPITHAANMTGNFLTAVLNVGESTLSGILSGRGLGDAKALLEGVAQKDTWADALRFAKRAWYTSQSTIDPLISKVDGTELAHGISYDTFKQTYVGQGIDYLATALHMDGALGRVVDDSGKFLRTTFDALGAEDEFFKVLSFRGALHREAYLEAYKMATAEGLQGTALSKRIGVLKAQLVDTPTEALFDKALETTRVNTFTANPKGILGGMNNLVANHPALQLFIPFTKTPTNLIHYVFDRVPALTLYQQEVRDALLNGTREQRAEIAARWSTGGLLLSSALGLAASGYITGGGGEHGAAQRVAGWQPYSIKVWDTYYSYNRLDPVSSLLGLAADTYDIITQAQDEEDSAKVATAAMIAVTRNITSKTMLKGFTELLDAVAQGDKKLPSFAKNFALSWVPAGVGAVERVTDPVLRDAITFMDETKAKIPGLSKTLPPKRDIFGEPIVPEGNLGPDFLSPVAVSKASPDRSRQLFADLGIDTTSDLKAMQQIDKVPLSVEQHSRFVETRGKMLKEAIDRLVESEQFSHLPEDKENPKSKQAIIHNIMSRTKVAARGKLFQEYPELLKGVQDRHKEFAQELQDSLAKP